MIIIISCYIFTVLSLTLNQHRLQVCVCGGGGGGGVVARGAYLRDNTVFSFQSIKYTNSNKTLHGLYII